MSSSSKRRQTTAKRAREHLVKERRALKAEKKQAAKDAKAAGLEWPPRLVDGETEGEPSENGEPSGTEIRQQ